LPSISMMNQAPPMQPGAAGPNDPRAQGAEGGDNAAQPPTQPQGAGPAVPLAPGQGGVGRPPMVAMPTAA
jgi:hypothetical protein